MSVQLELERTFLARYVPAQIDGARSEIIVDTYIPGDVDHATLRLRQRGELFEMTKKQPTSGNDSSQQTEHTVPLNANEYNVLKKVSEKTSAKQRYYCTFYGHDAEVDVFQEKLAGLILIDFEFDSAEDMEAFEPPEVCLAEVTQDALSAGGKLAGKSYEDIRYDLERYGYEPLFVEKEENA